MITDIKITDLSLCFSIQGTPTLPVCNNVVIAIDTRGENIERVVKAGIDLPSRINNLNLKGGYLKLIYAYDKQNIECVFRQSQSTLMFYGIKRDNGCIAAAFDMLNIKPVETPITMYRATSVLNVGMQWDKHVVADIITNNPEISRVAAVSESTCTLCSKKSKSLFQVSVCTEHGEHVKMTLKHDDYDGRKTIVTMSKLPCKNLSVYVSRVAARIFELYKELSEGITVVPSNLPITRVSGITHLRNMLPELFVNNYTRECPVLPVMLNSEQALHILQTTQRVIFYPVNSSMGRFYTAPDGYVVGLKKNRLDNRHIFPYLVTCYLNDHMLRVNSTTYAYYSGCNKVSNYLSKRIPRFMDQPGYSRRRTLSFVDAIETATGITIVANDIVWCPNIVKQDMWHMSDADIMDAIRNKNCGPSAYRYFEELLSISIHVVEINNASSDFFASKVRNYIWAAPYDRHIIIFEITKNTYGITHLSYDFLVNKQNESLLGNDDPVVSSVLRYKNEMFKPPHDIPNVVGQLIDEKGRCRVAVTRNNSCVMTLTRPYAVSIISDPACFFDEHTRKMNDIKNNIGLPAIDLYKRSTVHILYFPNDYSFQYWKNCQQEIRHT